MDEEDKSGLQSDYQLQPTLENPLATGPDLQAAERAANEALGRLRKRSELTNDLTDTVRGLVSLVALMCEMDTGKAFTFLTTGKVPA